MTIYYILYILILLVYLFSRRVKIVFRRSIKSENTDIDLYSRKKDASFTIIVSLMLVLLLGLRNQLMGIDLHESPGYLRSFDILSKMDWSKVIHDPFYNYEVGYRIMNKVIGSIIPDRQVFLFVCAALCVIPVTICIYRESKDLLLSIYIYIGLPTFLVLYSALRQAIALAITVFALQYIVERKFWRFLLIILLASTIHYSALIFIIAYPLYNLQLSRLKRIISLGLLPILWVLRYPLYSLFTTLLRRNTTVDNNGAVILFLVFVLIYIFCIIFGDPKNKTTNGLLNLFWIACAIQALGGVYSIVIRMGYYFMVYTTLLIPQVLNDMKCKTKNHTLIIFTRSAILIIFVLYGLYAIRNGGWAESYPYKFFWETM